MSSPFSIFLNFSDHTATVFIDPFLLFGPQPDKEGPVAATEAAIEAIPVEKVEEQGTECAICLEEFEVAGEAKAMTCRHRFHSGCIEKWLRVNGSCPVCRCRVPEEKREKGGEREMRIRFVNGEMVIQ